MASQYTRSEICKQPPLRAHQRVLVDVAYVASSTPVPPPEGPSALLALSAPCPVCLSDAWFCDGFKADLGALEQPPTCPRGTRRRVQDTGPMDKGALGAGPACPFSESSGRRGSRRGD